DASSSKVVTCQPYYSLCSWCYCSAAAADSTIAGVGKGVRSHPGGRRPPRRRPDRGATAIIMLLIAQSPRWLASIGGAGGHCRRRLSLALCGGQDWLRHLEDAAGSGRARVAGRRDLVVLVRRESLTGCRTRNRAKKSAPGRREANRGARFSAVDAFDFQHGFCKQPHLGVGQFRRENLREAAFHLVHAGNGACVEVEKFSVAAADDGQEFLFLAAARFAYEDDDFLPVQRLGRRFGHIQFLAGGGGLHRRFERHDANGGRM